MPHNIIKRMFIIAGLSNILGVLICSKFLTNQFMMEVQPSVMGFFGLINILLWGLAYIAVCKDYSKVRFLIAIFVIEKLIYVIAWLKIISTQSILSLYDNDILTGIFYTIYGLNDFIFMIFFSYVLVITRKNNIA